MARVILGDKSHASFIASIEACTFTHPQSEGSLAEFFASERNFSVLCFEGDELVSYCTVTTVLDEAQIINVATSEHYKRRGCAHMVMTRVLEECEKRGITLISLEVRESNASAISLYEKLGFLTAGKRRDFYRDPRENALVMIKNSD
ncbi:MAG: ribosomal protein S18-alanine N-acetyltransferase [Clostridia bacterium]|nr:ribosomal protein S18-alanine N-acetyltransferase [Clostridia bacterium]